MTRPSPILTALAAIATAAALTACSTDTGSQPQSDQSSAATADSTASAPDTSTASAAPPFPELGPFDPNLTGAEMPDPCLWATPEFMTELGYPRFTVSEVFNSFRDCIYAPADEQNPTVQTVSISFSKFPIGSPIALNESEHNGVEIFSFQDDLMSYYSFAYIETQQGAFVVGVSEFGGAQAALEAQAITVLKAFIEEYINAN